MITKKKRYVAVTVVLLLSFWLFTIFLFHKRSLIYLQVSQHLSEVVVLIRSLVFVCKQVIKNCRVKFYSMILILVYRFIFYQLSWGILGNKRQRGVNSSTRDLVALRRFGDAVSPNLIGSDFRQFSPFDDSNKQLFFPLQARAHTVCNPIGPIIFTQQQPINEFFLF